MPNPFSIYNPGDLRASRRRQQAKQWRVADWLCRSPLPRQHRLHEIPHISPSSHRRRRCVPERSAGMARHPSARISTHATRWGMPPRERYAEQFKQPLMFNGALMSSGGFDVYWLPAGSPASSDHTADIIASDYSTDEVAAHRCTIGGSSQNIAAARDRRSRENHRSIIR